MSAPLHILCVAADAPDLLASPYGPFVMHRCARLEEAAAELQARAHDAVVLMLPDATQAHALAAWPALSHAVLDAAVVVVTAEPELAQALHWLQLGIQDVVPPGDTATLARALRLAIERKRLERLARKAYATDLATGLPNHMQLLEHMTHLVALRAREPAPMALIVLRIGGLPAVQTTLGTEAANVLRRKIAVRLRSGLRASDVVAALGSDTFGVLLAWIDAPDDGERVARKLASALAQPFSVTGRERCVAVSAGLASFPEHGERAEDLLRRALGQAASVATVGAAGLASTVDRGADAAANDGQ